EEEEEEEEVEIGEREKEEVANVQSNPYLSFASETMIMPHERSLRGPLLEEDKQDQSAERHAAKGDEQKAREQREDEDDEKYIGTFAQNLQRKMRACFLKSYYYYYCYYYYSLLLFFL
ncbi:hypothetical protein RFI_14570, partial [Reticulomyxa filosa]